MLEHGAENPSAPRREAVKVEVGGEALQDVAVGLGATKRIAAHKQLQEGHAHTPEVRRDDVVDRRFGEELGGHVNGSADEIVVRLVNAADETAEAKINELDLERRWVNQDVVGLDVAVGHPT